MSGTRIGEGWGIIPSSEEEGLELGNYIMDRGIGKELIPISLDTVLTMTFDYTVMRVERLWPFLDCLNLLKKESFE